MRRAALLALSLVLTVPAAAQAQGQPTTAMPDELASVRAALDKYKDPVVAVHDGFLSTVGCIEYPKGGAEGAMKYPPGGMGVHFINMGNVGPALDPAKPQVLIYEPDGDKLKLVAAEWFMPLQLAGANRP